MPSRLLLTSNGLTNTAIDRALEAMLDKSVQDCRIVFVPTAANPVTGDKGWLVDDLRNVKRQRFEAMDVFDIAALEPADSLERMNNADVIMFGGGNAFYLMDVLGHTGIAETLPPLLVSRVYIGISAGGTIAGPDLTLSSHCNIWGTPEGVHDPGRQGLGLTDIRLRPHLDSDKFPLMRDEIIAPIAKTLDGPVYAVDDHAALAVVDGEVNEVGTGRVIRYN